MILISKEQFKKMVATQRVLDEKISKAKEIINLPLSRVESAYRVELAETINELKGAFKYWSSKDPNREAFIEEYVDALHFILSYSYRYADREAYTFDYIESEDRIDFIYRKIITKISKAERHLMWRYGNGLEGWQIADMALQKKNIFTSFAYLTILVEKYDFTTEEVIEAYEKKLAINHGRSDSGTY